MVGGRSLNFWVTALSAHASDMSSWLFMAYPMLVMTKGISYAWVGAGLVLGMWLNWHYIAPKLRVMTEKFGSFTLPSYLESRFNDKTGLIRITSASIMTLYLIHYLSAGLISMGFLFESLFQVDYTLGISVATAIVLAYTLFGGYVAVAWTDLFQGLFLLAMIIWVPFTALSALGGPSGIVIYSQEGLSIDIILTALAWGLGYFGMPHVLIKFLGIRSAKEVGKAKIVGISWQILSLSAAATVGVLGTSYFQGSLSNNELVFVEMVKGLFSPLFGGLILCGVIAATISTMDSQILVGAGMLANDFYRGKSDKYTLFASRVAVVVITCLALFIALSRIASVYETVFYAWTGLGCSFGPVMIFSLHWPRMTLQGAISGMIVGAATSGIWMFFSPWNVPAMLPGFLLSSLAIYGISRLRG